MNGDRVCFESLREVINISMRLSEFLYFWFLQLQFRLRLYALTRYPIMDNFASLVRTLKQQAKQKQPFIVGISGIDGSGKGYVGNQIFCALVKSGIATELIGIDGWLQVPSQRFSDREPAYHFYQNGFRFNEMSQMLFDPLSRDGSVEVWVKHSDPSNSDELIDYHYAIQGAEIVLFEGIFLFQDRFHFDYRIWIECSYQTALKRALQRNQEGLPEQQIIEDYTNIYFPAQKIHLKEDCPRERCDFIYLNDPQ